MITLRMLPAEMIKQLRYTGVVQIPIYQRKRGSWRVKMVYEDGKGLVASVSISPKQMPDYWTYLSNSRMLLYLPQPEDAGYFMSSSLDTTVGAPGRLFGSIGAVSCCHYRIMSQSYDLVAVQNCFRMSGRAAPPRGIATKYGGCQHRLMDTVFGLAEADLRSTVRSCLQRDSSKLRFDEVAQARGYEVEKLPSSCYLLAARPHHADGEYVIPTISMAQ